MSTPHEELVYLYKNILKSSGYAVEEEKQIVINNDDYDKRYIIDLYGKKGDEEILVECGDCQEYKLKDLRQVYDNVLHIPYVAHSHVKKYTRYEDVPFIVPVDHTIYQRVRRADDPLQMALNLGILDKKLLRKTLRKYLDLIGLEDSQDLEELFNSYKRKKEFEQWAENIKAVMVYPLKNL